MQTQKYNTAVLNNTTSNVILTTMLTVCSNTTTLHYTIYIWGKKSLRHEIESLFANSQAILHQYAVS